MDIVTDIYNPEVEPAKEEDAIDVPSEVIEQTQIAIVPSTLTDRELLVAVYEQQQQLGNQLNWLCENLAGVFGMVTAMSQNGGGIRGLMKVMKEMNNG